MPPVRRNPGRRCQAESGGRAFSWRSSPGTKASARPWRPDAPRLRAADPSPPRASIRRLRSARRHNRGGCHHNQRPWQTGEGCTPSDRRTIGSPRSTMQNSPLCMAVTQLLAEETNAHSGGYLRLDLPTALVTPPQSVTVPGRPGEAQHVRGIPAGPCGIRRSPWAGFPDPPPDGPRSRRRACGTLTSRLPRGTSRRSRRGTRPRSLTSIPCPLAHSRTAAISLPPPAAPRPARPARRDPAPETLRPAVINLASAPRSSATCAALRSIS
jgi:hypothetical protein